MYVNSTAFFNNSLITNNYAGGYGGALVTDDKANINFVNTQFILNKALVRRIKNDIVVFLPYFFVWLLNSNIHRDVFFFLNATVVATLATGFSCRNTWTIQSRHSVK